MVLRGEGGIFKKVSKILFYTSSLFSVSDVFDRDA